MRTNQCCHLTGSIMVLSWSCYSTFVSVKSKGNRDLGCQKLQKFLACGAACLPRSGTSKRSLFSLAHRYLLLPPPLPVPECGTSAVSVKVSCSHSRASPRERPSRATPHSTSPPIYQLRAQASARAYFSRMRFGSGAAHSKQAFPPKQEFPL